MNQPLLNIVITLDEVEVLMSRRTLPFPKEGIHDLNSTLDFILSRDRMASFPIAARFWGCFWRDGSSGKK